MSGQSLGLIETVGLAVAIEAADAAMKSANVELVGYELTKGGGLVTVKLAGEVGAMNAAVAAGVAAAHRIGSVYAWKVIARTATGIHRLIASEETNGVDPQDSAIPSSEKEAPVAEHKEDVIPTVNIEPEVLTADCTDRDNHVATDTPAHTQTSIESESTQNENSAAPKISPESVAQDNKKSARARAKNPRG
ncbi:BMC domain-containing protein [Pectobacterium parmentieri]|uniref:BMC domain-containing protein n=1 Tax=Pectobacterium parmentieri TaxID=1905730 RepID=UPI0018E16CC0|nr:BMC domain-containing protein [Pectobacterium parmentieri]QQA76409.1 BMC domain-containing protein [Pectobacterium parmentieri]